MDWNKEASYIERIVHQETGPEFNHCDNTQHEYCMMQYRAARRAGAFSAASRIREAIISEWPQSKFEESMSVSSVVYHALVLVYHRLGELPELDGVQVKEFGMDMGLCRAVLTAVRHNRHEDQYATGAILSCLHECFAKWPQFSGDEVYPVPGFGEHYTEEAHNEARDLARPYADLTAQQRAEYEFDECPATQMWDDNTKYGAARIDLLRFALVYFRSKA